MSSKVATGSGFPLFLAPLDEADGHQGAGECAVCRHRAEAVFSLGIGADVVYTCSGCGESYPVPVDEHDGATVTCPHCEASAPAAVPSEGAAACVSCVRAGRVALTKDTEYGMVRWEDAVRGGTFGMPESVLGDVGSFSVTPLDVDDADDDADDERWVSVQVPSAVLHELLRTPAYPTWQGERWLFCCGDAMSFVGNWTREDLAGHAPGDEATAFQEIFQAEPWLLEQMPSDRDGSPDALSFYAFRCRACGRFRGHYDST